MTQMTLLQEYIVQQPALWRALLDSREEITGAFARRFGDLRPDRVVLIGSGSSHYAALMARPVLERAWGAEVTCLVPSEAAGARLTGERPLYLAISQSGVSTNTYELVTALTGAGHPVAAVTERADSPVGSAATLAVTLRIGEERIGAKTKGVTATVLTLMLMALCAILITFSYFAATTQNAVNSFVLCGRCLAGISVIMLLTSLILIPFTLYDVFLS